MPADSISAGVLLLSWGATYFVHSTCLVAAVWLFLRIRRSAGHAIRETLWKTALVGGVATASAQMWLVPSGPFGNLTLKLEGIGSPIAALENPPIATDADSVHAIQTIFHADHRPAGESPQADPGHEIWIVTENPQAEIAAASGGLSAERGATAQIPAAPDKLTAYFNSISKCVHALPEAIALAVALAISAILLGIARCGWQTILLRRKLSRCRVIDSGPARTLLDELLREVTRTPEVLLLCAPEDPEPAALGVARWTIVLPTRAVLDLSEDELRALLAHELAHLVRGDSTWLCISRVLCSCLAFQPLNHLARREWQRAAEFLCDNWAVSQTGAPLALARCLTEVASWRLAGRASAAILAATGRKSGLVDRIERLLDARPIRDSRSDLCDRCRTVIAGAVVLAFLAWCAPRVQLVAAGPLANGEPVPVRIRLAAFETSYGENDVGDSNLADAAKPQASGERQKHDGEFEAEALPAEPAIMVDRAAGDYASILEAVERDLVALESELEQLGPLLHEKAIPQAGSLAKRLRGEIARLKQRREMLKTLSRKPVD